MKVVLGFESRIKFCFNNDSYLGDSFKSGTDAIKGVEKLLSSLLLFCVYREYLPHSPVILIKKLWRSDIEFVKIGMLLTKLVDEDVIQLSLFDDYDCEEEQPKKLM